MSNYSIGNSLTGDALPQVTPGWHYHLRGGVTLPQIFADPDQAGDLFDPSRWDDAFAATQYDYISVQPYNTSSPDQDATPINSWVTEQPNATFVLHDSPASRDNFESQYHATNDNWHSKQGQDARAARFKADNPNVPLRETNANDALDFILHDIANAPFASFTDMYRDVTHMSLDRGRFLLNNLMRSAFRQPYINSADFQALTGNSPDSASETYLLSVANQFTPGYWTYTGGTTMLAHGYGNPGADYDFYAWNSDGDVWSNIASAFVTWSDADFVDYRIAAIETGSSGRFEANLPDGTANYDMRVRGGALADSFAVWEDAIQHGLTAVQAANNALIDDIKAKTDLINSGAPIETLGDVADGDDLTIRTAATLQFDVVDTGDLSSDTDVWFTVKRCRDDPDSDAIVQVSVASGLITPSTGTGSITPNADSVTIEVDDEATATLDRESHLIWDMKRKQSGGDITVIAEGRADVVESVTQAT